MSEIQAPLDIGVSRQQAVEGSRNSLDFFAALCVPEVFKFRYPEFFKAIWQILTTAALKPVGKDRLAVGIPRGFGKTMLLKLFVAWLIAFTDRKFILVVCNTATLAENFISDVTDILSAINFIRVFGDYRYTLEKDTQELKKFSFKGRSVILAGLGSGSSLRGLNIKFVRPDVIIQDDMQSKEQAASEVESKKLLSWMVGTLMKANDNNRCLHIFIGNMYAYEGCILAKLQVNPAWISLITGALLEDGESLWPELRSVDDILQELENDDSLGQAAEFFAEVMNDPVAGSRSGVDFSKINVWQRDDEELQQLSSGGFVTIDPSGSKKKSDDTCIAATLIYDTEPVIREAVHKKMKPDEIIDTAIKYALQYQLPAIVVEDVAFQSTLLFFLEQRLQQLGIANLLVLPINPGGVGKVPRILDGLRHLTAGKERIILHKSVKPLVTHQITYFDPLKNNNKDDLLDIVAYQYKIIAIHGEQLIRPFAVEAYETDAAYSDTIAIGF